MIKAVTTRNTKKGDRRTLGAEVEIEGTKLELLHEFLGILAIPASLPVCVVAVIVITSMSDNVFFITPLAIYNTPYLGSVIPPLTPFRKS